MIRRPPRSTQSRSSAASDVYKRQGYPDGQLEDHDSEHQNRGCDQSPQSTRDQPQVDDRPAQVIPGALHGLLSALARGPEVQCPLHSPDRLADAVFVLDQCEANVLVPRGAEPNAGAERDPALGEHELCELEAAQVTEGFRDASPR